MLENTPRGDAGPTPPVDSPPSTPPASVMTELSAPAQPVVVAPVRAKGGGGIGLRWVVALLAVVLVGTVSFAGYRLLAAGQTTTSPLAAFAPASSLMYAEFHADAPGDQHQKLAAFLAHFPALGDSSDLDARLTELYDTFVKQASKNSMTYTADVAPWFGGTFAVAVTGLPSRGAMSTRDLASKAPDALVIIAVKDQAAAKAWIARAAGLTGKQVETSTYAGVELSTSGEGSYAVLPTALLLGDTGSVKAAIDGQASGGLGSVAAFVSATKSLSGSSLGLSYIDTGRYADWLTSQAPKGASCATAAAAIPAWSAGTFAVDNDALVSHATWPRVSGGVNVANASPALLQHIPSSALAVVDGRAAGAHVRHLLEQLQSCQSAAGGSPFGDIDSLINRFGGWDKLTGWIGETALVLDREGTNPTGGLLIVPADRASADTFLTQIKNLAALSGQVASTDSTYAGAALTTFGAAKASGSAPTIAVANADGYLVAGPEAWVKKVLDTSTGGSLGSSARFTAALGRVSAQNTALVYADVAGLRDWLETAMPKSEAAEYEEYAKRYLAPFDTLVATVTAGGDLDRLDAAITVK